MKLEEWQEKDIETEAEHYSIDGVEPEPSVWSIEDDLTADWTVGKIRDIERSIDRQEEIARQWISYYQGQIEALEEKRRKQTSFLRGCLAQYFEHVERRKTKTGIEKYDLLSGRLVRKPATQKIVKASEEELITWCAASGQSRFIKRIEKVDWAGLKKKLTIIGDEVVDSQSGEVVAGCAVEDVPEEFKVEVQASAATQRSTTCSARWT